MYFDNIKKRRLSIDLFMCKTNSNIEAFINVDLFNILIELTKIIRIDTNIQRAILIIIYKSLYNSKLALQILKRATR